MVFDETWPDFLEMSMHEIVRGFCYVCNVECQYFIFITRQLWPTQLPFHQTNVVL